VPQSDALALRWFQKAAQQGQTGAQIKLGYMYMTGRGVPKSMETAYAWILAAAESGDHRGDEYLPAVKAQLTAEQLTHAAGRAEELQSKFHRPNSTETAFVR
jgi:TPR repeat protein